MKKILGIDGSIHRETRPTDNESNAVKFRDFFRIQHKFIQENKEVIN
jgi:hypothetical protein